MYLSKNSRYVLKKAQVLSPKIFRVAHNNLSVKTPYDDPSKPALRVNIPKEGSEEEGNEKSIHGVGDHKTRTFTNRSQTSSIPSTYDDDLLTKTNENHVRFPSLVTDKILMSSDLDKTSKASSIESQSYQTRTTNKDDYTEGLRTSLDEEATERAVGNQSSTGEESKNAEGNVDPKSLYIIIDVPEYSMQKSMETSTPEAVQEENKNQYYEKGEFDPAAFKARLDRQKSEEGSTKKSWSKIPSLKKNSNRTKRFDINEIEEPATYVFHLRFNKQMADRSTGVGCVPEKEIKTRNENLNSNYVHIKIADSANDTANVGKHVSSIEELPNFKHAETLKKHGVRKNGASNGGVNKSNLLRVSKSSGSIPQQEVNETEDGQPLQKYIRKSKNFIKKNLAKSEKVSKPKDKNIPFSLPMGPTEIHTMERPEEKASEGEETGAELRREYSAPAVSSEYQYPKMETEADTNRYVKETSSQSYSASQQSEEPREYSSPYTAYGSKEQKVNEYQTQQTSYATHQKEIPERHYPNFISPESHRARYQQQYVNEYQEPSPAKTEENEIPENQSPYFSIFDLKTHNQPYEPEQSQQYNSAKEVKQQKEEYSSPYFSIHELTQEKTDENENQQINRNVRPMKKQCEESSIEEKPVNPNKQEFSKPEKIAMSFHTSSTCVSIGCEKLTNTSKFCAAFPPLLSEALKHRIKFGKDFFLNDKFNLSNDKTFDKNPVPELSENSILFPKKESEKFDCESLFGTREDTILKIIKSSDEKKVTEKTSQRPATSPAEKSVDGLTLMKKVKEIVQFDLDNVVKIFNTIDTKQDVSSVLLLHGDNWKVDVEELKKQREKSMKRMENAEESKTCFKKEITGDKMTNEPNSVKYLPPEKENEMKLDSVINYDSNTERFFIKKDILAKTIAEKTNASPEEVAETLNILAQNSTMQAKGGDSILVFDDETQSWKVDFSILEKREEQMKIEAELTKRSELILETFEQLEKGHLSNVPLPDSRGPKTFDYKNEQWSSYNPEKKSKDSSKQKSPFKEPDAEEIRKKNSDLYENLFVANKKNGGINKSGKIAPEVDPSKPIKKSKSYSLSDRSQDTTGSSGPQKGSESTPIKPPEPPKEGPPPPPAEKENPIKDDDNFWETFLKMNILPRDIRDIINPTKPVDKPSKPPTNPIITPESDPLGDLPSKKIEEPRFKIRIPFIKDKKIEKPMDSSESKGEIKPEDTPKKPPKHPDNISTGKKEKSDVKVPPPSPSSTAMEDPKNPKTPPSIGSSKGSTETPKDKPSPPITKQDPKPSSKNDKMASATDHYVSDKIIEISRNKPVENQPKSKIETVKVNLTPDTRLPSKVTEINLNKKFEEKVKETQQNPTEVKKPSEEQSVEKKTFYKNMEKYKTPFSDPDYEEKSVKIKSDIESNPNLKKLDNWNKTLVLQDIMKPPENIESWLKDETDKMATLLLKVLQEAADGKPKKKQPTNKPKDKQGRGNPYDNIRKKQETTPENFLFRVRTVNLSLENDKKAKQGEEKQNKSEQLKDIPVQSEKTVQPSKVVDAIKFPELAKEGQTSEKDVQVPVSLENTRNTASQSALETAVQSAVMSREFSHANKAPVEISEEIPGPELLKKISNAWKMFPILGSQMTIFTLLRMFQLVNLGSSLLGSPNPDKVRRHAFTKLFTKYGPIVNVQGPLSGNVILIHNPEHLNGVFEQDITASVRSVFDSVEQSRREVEDNGMSVGISTDWTKPEWIDLKKGTIDTIMKGSGNYFRICELAADSLVNNIRRNRNLQNYASEDFMEDIKRWSLEALCNVLFEKSISVLERRNCGLNWNMEPEKMHSAIEEATDCLSKCERGFQLWRLMSTPSATGLSRAYRTISSIMAKAIYQAEMNLKGKAELLKSGSSLPVRDLTFLESMLLNDGMTTDEITCNLIDMLLLGTNAMSSALGFILYNMAQNVKVQMKLLKELKEVLPTKDCQLSYTDLASLKYLQACLKESLRLNFPLPLFYRLLQNDILLSNYIVPKGTYVVMDFRVSSMKEQIFDDPDKFIPERWLLDEKWMKDLHPFGAFPLCHGPRAEMAKKVVEMQLLATIAKIIRNFHVEYQYGEIQGTDTIISFPDKPLKLSFAEREI